MLKSLGIKKGDTVSIYLPMTWEAVAAFLACARIGAVHSVVFAGFSAESLRDRVQDCACRVVITSDEGRRGGKTIANKAIVDAALKECPLVEHVLVHIHRVILRLVVRIRMDGCRLMGSLPSASRSVPRAGVQNLTGIGSLSDTLA